MEKVGRSVYLIGCLLLLLDIVCDFLGLACTGLCVGSQ